MSQVNQKYFKQIQIFFAKMFGAKKKCLFTILIKLIDKLLISKKLYQIYNILLLDCFIQSNLVNLNLDNSKTSLGQTISVSLRKIFRF